METQLATTPSPQNPPPAETPKPAPVVEQKPPKVKWGATYVFRLRRQAEGPFPNLWELSILDSKACGNAPVKKLISDADALVYCLDNLQGELEAAGL